MLSYLSAQGRREVSAEHAPSLPRASVKLHGLGTRASRWAAGAWVLAVCLSARPAHGQGNPTSLAGRAAPASTKERLASQLTGLFRVISAASIRATPMPADTGPRPRYELESERAFRQWTDKYMPPDSVEAVEMRALAETYTEDDLRALVEFFSTPVGKRFLTGADSVIRIEVGEQRRVLAAHRAELQQMLMEAGKRAIPHGPGR